MWFIIAFILSNLSIADKFMTLFHAIPFWYPIMMAQLNTAFCITSMQITIEKTKSGFDRHLNNHPDQSLDKAVSCCPLCGACRNSFDMGM